jgi:segregation and condensation protein A
MHARGPVRRYGRRVAVEISTPSFEGPIEVLAQLISDHRVDIYEIRLADIVSEFLEALLADQRPGLEEQSEFLLTVAILLELKSRRLLPGPDAVESDEELDGLEERDRLLARLIELQAYARAAELFAVMVEQASRSVPRTAGLEDQFVGLAPDLLEGLAPEDLLAAFRRVMTERPVPVLDLSHVTVEAVTVSEALADVASRLALARRSTFRDLTAHCTTRMQVIVRFLALLELAKRGRVVVVP